MLGVNRASYRCKITLAEKSLPLLPTPALGHLLGLNLSRPAGLAVGDQFQIIFIHNIRATDFLRWQSSFSDKNLYPRYMHSQFFRGFGR